MMRVATKGVLVASATMIAFGCNGDLGDIPGPTVITPKRVVEDTTLPVTSYALPDDLTSDPTISLGQYRGILLAGGKKGLYSHTGNGKWKQLDDQPVVDIAWQTEPSSDYAVLLIAHPDGFHRFDGTLRDSPLYGFLRGGNVKTVQATTNDRVWIGTDRALWLLDGHDLLQFSGVVGATHISTFGDSGQAVIRTIDGAVVVLRRNNDKTWSLGDLGASDQQRADEVISSRDGSYFRRDKSTLMKRYVDDHGTRWLPYQITAERPLTVESVSTDPVTGSTWIVSDGDLFRIDGESALRVNRPKNVGATTSAHVLSGGALYVATENQAIRIGHENAVTYTRDIADGIDRHCISCHKSGGQASFALDSYSALVEYADAAIDAMRAGQMPPTGTPDQDLIGQLELWRASGYRE